MKLFSSFIFNNAKTKGNHIAVIDQNGLRKTTLDELIFLSKKVACYAKSKDLSGVIPILMERSVEATATIFGLNMAGLGVAPVSANTPLERVNIIESETKNAAWKIDDYNRAMASDNEIDLPATDAKEPAFVIFTSGSTGVPKGVMLSNHCVIKACMRLADDLFEYTENDIVLQNAPFSFVVCISDLLAPIYGGSQVHILPEAARKDPWLMSDYINKHKCTTSFASPKLLRYIGDNVPSIRLFIVGSERVSRLAPKNYKLINGYGLSETASGSLVFNIDKEYDNTPIGKTFGNFEAYILDNDGNLANEGELCLSGDISDGYYNQPELTARVFTKNPFSNKEGHEVLFHTGDIVKRLADGNIVYLNRKDFMIKINGQRVEPGESETAIKNLFNIKEAAVVGFTENDGRTYLCAYYESENEIDSELFRKKLSKILPKYMIPSYFVRLDKLPVNYNGKLDRKALVPPKTSEIQKDYVAPVGETETVLCHAFEKTLKLDRIGSEDDFIILGGDSISAMEVVRLSNGLNLTAQDILNFKTPKAIASQLSQKSDESVTVPLNGNDYSPLTNSQMGIYLQCMLRTDSTMYNLPTHISFANNGKTADEIKTAIDSVIKAHSALYAFLKPEDESIFICRNAFPHDGICTCEEREAQYTESEEKAFVRPFDLFRGPLCRAHIVLTSDKIHLYFDCHHIVADGTSEAFLVKQFSNALCGKAIEEEIIDAFSVYDFDKCAIDDEKLNCAKQYFENLFAGYEIDSNLIFDKKLTQESDYEQGKKKITFAMPELSKYIKENSLTESSFFMGVFGYAIAKMTGQNDSIFAVAESGRKDIRFDNTVSMFVRTLPVIYHLDETQPASALLAAGQNQFYNSVGYDYLSFSEIANDNALNADIMFVYQSDMIHGFEDENGKVEIGSLDLNESFSNLAVSVWKEGDGFTVSAEYRKACYNEKTIERFLNIYQNIAKAFAKNEVLSNIPLIDEADCAFLDELNKTELEYEKGKTVVDLFRETVLKYGSKIALVCKERKYTYKEVDELSNRISAYIHKSGISKGETVSILINRNEYMLIASLGALKAGAIYQPLDSSYPGERLAFMCKDADSKLLIADKELLPILPDYKETILTTDEIKTLPEESYDGKPDVNDGFVLLYTSGTTGLPKGCKILHKNVASYVNSYNYLFNADCNSVSGAYASYGFDAHLSEIYPMAVIGGELHIITEDIRLDLPALKNYFEENKISHTVMTTQIARQFVSEYSEVKHLRSILAGGEKLATITPPLNYTLTNGYGPSEATVMVTCFKLDKVYDNIPVGTALPNTKLYVVDSFGRRVPVGVPGELIAFGPQVSAGYINRPEKTAEVFIKNTYSDDAEYENGYKTGDIVRFVDDGNLEIIGRRDMQVKIRGFRIELSEIETVIREFPDVKDSTVIAVDDAFGGKTIHAYIVADKKIDIDELNKFIKERKPPYMVPSATMQIESIPMTPNFKVDKRKLPPMNVKSENVKNETRQLTTLEQSLCDMLKEIVGNENFSVETEFTAAGITSITSIRLAVQIYKQYGLHITSKEILDGGTILSVENSIISMLINNRDSQDQKPVETKTSFKLTKSQLGVYIDSLSRGMATYLIPMLVELYDGTDLEKLKAAIKKAVKAHGSMQCFVYADEDEALIHKVDNIDFEIEEIESATLNIAPTEFKFEKNPLFNFRIIKSNGKCYLLIEAHHIIADGESLNILLRDIETIYNEGEIEEEKYTAFDISVDEENARNGHEFESAKAYYDSVFRGIPNEYIPTADMHGESSFGELDFKPSLDGNAIKAFCKEKNISENILFNGAFAVTLAKFTAHQDALFSTIHNGRTDPRTENVVSMLVKTLPFYIEAPGEKNVEGFLKNVDDRLKKLKKYDLYSFADAAREYGITADIMFIYQGELLNKMPLGKLVKMQNKASASKTALSLEVCANPDGYNLHCEYNAGKYSEKWIAGFVEAYATCVEQIIKVKALNEIEICSQNALSEFGEFNSTYWDVTPEPAYRLIERSVQRHPEKLAVVTEEGSLTYKQLDNISNELSRKIAALGINERSTISILTGRTKEIYTAEIGVLKAGCAFLFLSPEYPAERIAFILKDSSTKAIITTHAIEKLQEELLSKIDIPVIYADDIDENIESTSLNLDVDVNALAYMIYTSGSTGQPKGVTVTQNGLINIANRNPFNDETTLFVDDESVSVAVSAFTFDASVMEGFVALANGSTVCIASDNAIHNPDVFCKYCLDNNVDRLFGTPSFLLNLTDYEGFYEVAKRLKTVLAGGEEFTTVLLNRLYEMNNNLCIMNGYGPSEATVTCSNKILKHGEPITIGTPISNTELYCLDAHNHILPMGALGELTILGQGVGKGYINRDDLTKKAFIKVKGKNAFKTGDLAVITHDGEIEFHGRIDNQVKIRGLRVELGEIENVMCGVDGVKSAVVLVKGEGENKYLVAYYTATREISSDEITAYISEKLTKYMVPKLFRQVEAMPMTANGKIDRKALPEIQVEKRTQRGANASSEVEKTIADVVKKVLKLDEVFLDDNFFEIGGNSLAASKVVMQLKSKGFNIEYQTIFDYQTIRALANCLDKSSGESHQDEVDFSKDPTDEKYRDILKHNTMEYADMVERKPLGDLLLTGSVGFLGIHILKAFLESENGRVYCLVRKGKFPTPEKRLDAISFYYFGECLREKYHDRISIINADITSENLLSELENYKFETIINCAASVKHFASDNSIEFVNVNGVKNLISVAKAKGAKLIQISTTSIPGAHTKESYKAGAVLKENQIFIADDMNNQYVISKYHAELCVLDAVKDGLKGKIIRVGNLMGRHSDGEFQINMGSNAFLNALKGFACIGKYPVGNGTHPMEFSPIDCTAEAIVALAGTNDEYTVFHANNRYSFDEMKLMNVATDCGIPIIPINDKQYYAEFERLLGDEKINKHLSALMTNDRPDVYPVEVDNRFTTSILYRIGFSWPFIDDQYLHKVITSLRDIGFFDIEQND